jgi:cytochrome c-type biogenesis protein
MDSLTVAAFSALWLGILTSISPCPLATNIAAVSYIGKRVESARYALWTGVGYVFGRLLTYVVVGAVVTAGLMSIPGVSNFLQKYMNSLLGPVLILVGLILLGWLSIPLPGLTPNEKVQQRVASGGVWGAVVLGAFFALSFCPVSAALFFGSLVPLALQHQSYLLLPSLYGIGTGLPVLLFGVLIAFSTHTVGKVFGRVTQVEYWIRKSTGVLFVLIGIYYILRYVFLVF